MVIILTNNIEIALKKDKTTVVRRVVIRFLDPPVTIVESYLQAGLLIKDLFDADHEGFHTTLDLKIF
jgi:hypothetical protein